MLQGLTGCMNGMKAMLCKLLSDHVSCFSYHRPIYWILVAIRLSESKAWWWWHVKHTVVK